MFQTFLPLIAASRICVSYEKCSGMSLKKLLMFYLETVLLANPLEN